MSADFTPDFKDYNVLKPFRFWCQKVLPLVYDDSLSYYEVLCKIKDYLNNTIEDVANVEDNVQSMYNAFVSLQAWVNDYFDNLDLTEELTPIVQEELDRVLGDITYDSSTKTAIMVPGSGTVMDDVVENIQILNKYPIADASAREWIDDFNYTPSRVYQKAVFIGDSYLEGWTPDGTNPGWGALLAGRLGLTVNTDAFIYHQGGSGFAATNNNRNFVTMLNEAIADTRFDNGSVDLVIVGGGFNDQNYSYSDIVTAITPFAINARNAFPNARVYLVDMCWSQYAAADRSTVYNKDKVLNAYYNGCIDNHLIPFVDCWKALIGVDENDHELLASDGVHPNSYGEIKIANAIYSFITGGHSVHAYSNVRLTTNPVSALFASFNGDSITAMLTALQDIPVSNWSSLNGVCNGNNLRLNLPAIKGLAPVTNMRICGNANILVQDDNGYYELPCTAGMIDGRITLYPLAINAGKNGYLALANIKYTQIHTLNINVPAIWA